MKDRWLLPFTHGIDVHALEQVLHLAEVGEAQLVPVALVPVEQRSSGARLEHIQQAKDFSEVIRHKATRYQVPVECHEVFTSDVGKRITELVQELHCESIVLVTREQQGLLLHAKEAAGLLTSPPATLVHVRLPGPRRRTRIAHLLTPLLSLLGKLRGYPDKQQQMREPTPLSKL